MAKKKEKSIPAEVTGPELSVPSKDKSFKDFLEGIMDEREKKREIWKKAEGGMIGRKKKTGDARKAPKTQPYHQDTSTHKRYANSVRGARWPEDWKQQ